MPNMDSIPAGYQCLVLGLTFVAFAIQICAVRGHTGHTWLPMTLNVNSSTEMCCACKLYPGFPRLVTKMLYNISLIIVVLNWY